MTVLYKFKKGQRIHLDEIYSIQGLGGGEGTWWEREDKSDDTFEELVILCNVTFTIKVKFS